MWGGGGGAGPKVPPGTYTVKVSSGSWSQTQTFRLHADPRFTPMMTEAEGQEQLRLANEVGGMINTLYTELARLRDAKRQANELAEKSPANSPVRSAAKTLVDKLTAAESELTQIRGEGGQEHGRGVVSRPDRVNNDVGSSRPRCGVDRYRS